MLRSSVKVEDTYDLESIYENLDKWELDYHTISKKVDSIKELKGTAKNGPQAIKKIFDTYFNIMQTLQKLRVYALLATRADLKDEKNRAAYSNAQTITNLFDQNCSWINSEILSLDHLDLDNPNLKEYSFYLKQIVRLKPHILSDREEELIKLANESLSKFGKAFEYFNDVDLKFNSVKDSNGKEHTFTLATYGHITDSLDRELRKNGFFEFCSKYKEFENTLAELHLGRIKSHIFRAKSHHYSSTLEAALFPYNIPVKVHHNLISTIRNGISTLHDYFKLRKCVLKLDTMHFYDLSVPLLSQVKINYSYDEAVQIIINAVKPLGSEYQQILADGLTKKRWVDKYPNQNKHTGAYCVRLYGKDPRLSINYENKLRHVCTLAHETGHGMHNYYTSKDQPFHCSSYSSFVSEVASTFHEELFLQYMLKESKSHEEKAQLLITAIEQMWGKLFHPTMLTEFEKILVEAVETKKSITPKFLSETYLELCQFYYGSDVKMDNEISSRWARNPQIYDNFHTYQYATSISASIALADNVLSEKEGAKERYLKFLSAGGSDFPITLLKNAGVDMESSEPIEQAIKRFQYLTNCLKEELIALKMIEKD